MQAGCMNAPLPEQRDIGWSYDSGEQRTDFWAMFETRRAFHHPSATFSTTVTVFRLLLPSSLDLSPSPNKKIRWLAQSHRHRHSPSRV